MREKIRKGWKLKLKTEPRSGVEMMAGDVRFFWRDETNLEAEFVNNLE